MCQGWTKGGGQFTSCSPGGVRATTGTECCLQSQLLSGRPLPVPFVLPWTDLARPARAKTGRLWAGWKPTPPKVLDT